MSAPFGRPLPDGVHLGLDTEEYFDQDCLGSTDLISLYFQRWGWWWQSRHNPDYKEPDKKAYTYGSALHAIMLEGVASYESRFAVAPDKKSFTGLIDTTEEIQAVLREANFNLSGTSKWKKPDWLLEIRSQLPHVPVWSNIMADFADEVGRKTIVSAVEDRQLRFMREVAVASGRDDNAEIKALFADVHPPLAEVSIFWVENGVRRRARIDRMFPAFDVDLKSLLNWSGRRLDYYIGELIAKHGYDIQRADYYDARAAAMEHIRAGRVFGGTLEQRSWLEGYAQMSRPVGDWVWLFYQKPELSGRAPVLVPVMDYSWAPRGHSSDAPRPGFLRQLGAQKKAQAIDFYIGAVAKFGLEQPWARVEDLHYSDDAFRPHIILPNWIGDVDPDHGIAFTSGVTDEQREADEARNDEEADAG